MVQIYTIEEAKTKSCCMMNKCCEASGCMAWKNHVTFKEIPQQGNRPQPPKSESTVDKNKGYCGLVRQ